MYVVLVQYPHLVTCVVVSPYAILLSIVPNFAPQELPLLIENDHGDVMEDSEWVHKGSRWCYKVDACTNS
jgi:hypothetical protein